MATSCWTPSAGTTASPFFECCVRERSSYLCAGGVTPEIAKAATARGVTVRTLLDEPDGAGLEHLAALVDAGQLRVEVEQALPLGDATAAHRDHSCAWTAS